MLNISHACIPTHFDIGSTDHTLPLCDDVTIIKVIQGNETVYLRIIAQSSKHLNLEHVAIRIY